MKLVGYGYLLSGLVDYKPKKITPILVKGKRIFNLISREPEDGFTVLNIEPSERMFNAVLLDVNEKEFEVISSWEVNYDFEEIEIFDLESKSLGTANIWIGKKEKKDERKPKRKYFKMCREFAYKISEDFGKKYDETTFLPDGRNLTEWLKDNEDYL